MSVRTRMRGSTRWAVVVGSALLALGGIGVTITRADSASPSTVRHGRAIGHEATLIHVHGPFQVPKFGRIDLMSGGEAT